jgi:hypothetical protein
MTLFREGSNHAAASILRIPRMTARNHDLCLVGFRRGGDGGRCTESQSAGSHSTAND